jgi:hypothetical protein
MLIQEFRGVTIRRVAFTVHTTCPYTETERSFRHSTSCAVVTGRSVYLPKHTELRHVSVALLQTCTVVTSCSLLPTLYCAATDIYWSTAWETAVMSHCPTFFLSFFLFSFIFFFFFFRLCSARRPYVLTG